MQPTLLNTQLFGPQNQRPLSRCASPKDPFIFYTSSFISAERWPPNYTRPTELSLWYIPRAEASPSTGLSSASPSPFAAWKYSAPLQLSLSTGSFTVLGQDLLYADGIGCSLRQLVLFLPPSARAGSSEGEDWIACELELPESVRTGRMEKVCVDELLGYVIVQHGGSGDIEVLSYI